MRNLFVLILTLLLAPPVMGQKVKKVEGEYMYHAPENVTLEQARRTALDRAKIKAIADEFGTLVSNEVIIKREISGEKTSSDFVSIGGSEVKGEWLETIGEPEYNITYEGNMLVVTCKVKGRAREIVTAPIDLKVHVLCNGTEDKYEDDDFKSGDDLYLSFLSPVSGYLAVYLIDAENKANCLLPYRSQPDGVYPIEANHRYVFFSEKQAPAGERGYVDEYVLTCDRSSENNFIYVIFSPNQFTKAADVASNDYLPRYLSFGDFQSWLVKCRKHDKDMNQVVIPLTVSKSH